MNLLATPTRRKVLFGFLYLSEGAPIGFIWLGMPTRMRTLDVPLDRITWLLALLILPWTLKFVWAPVVDVLRGPRWGFKHWIMVCQGVMALTLVPLWFLDLRAEFSIISVWLLLHAIAAATQDVAIDALCINASTPDERGALNGWMQCGVLTGRAVMGGGSLVLERWIGFGGVVAVLIGLVLLSLVLLLGCREQLADRRTDETTRTIQPGHRHIWRRDLVELLRGRTMWIGLGVALFVPAAFKSLEAVLGPFLVDRGFGEFSIGMFTSTAMIVGMIGGSLLAGRLSLRISAHRLVGLAVACNVAAILTLAATDWIIGGDESTELLIGLTVVAVTIGLLTVALYNWLMNLTNPRLAATQFTAFMAATNACEAWSTAAVGQLQGSLGYAGSMAILCVVTGVAAVILLSLAHRHLFDSNQESVSHRCDASRS